MAPGLKWPRNGHRNDTMAPQMGFLPFFSMFLSFSAAVFRPFQARAIFIWGAEKEPINRKHINIFLTALAGQSSQGQTGTRRMDKWDKMVIFREPPVCPWDGSDLSRGWVPFVSGKVPVCPGHRPVQNVYVYWIFPCPKSAATPQVPHAMSTLHGSKLRRL